MDRALNVKSRLNGPVVPLNICFNPDGSVDYSSVTRYVGWLCDQKVPIIMTTYGSSEFRGLMDDEIWRLTEEIASVTAGRSVFVASTGWWKPSKCREFLKHADSVGADAVKVQIHPWYPKDRPTLVGYFDAIGDAGEIPLLLWGHSPPAFPVDVAVELSRRPNIVGMKNDGDQFYDYYDLCRRTRDNNFAVISGGQMRNFAYGYQVGSTAYLCTVAPFRPDISLAFYTCLTEGRYPEAWQYVYRYEEAWLKLAVEVDWLVAIKSAIQLHGLYPNNRVSPPVPGAKPGDYEKVRQAMKDIFGLH